jgi:hypothetical protein
MPAPVSARSRHSWPPTRRAEDSGRPHRDHLFILPELVEHLELAQFLQTAPELLEIRVVATST